MYVTLSNPVVLMADTVCNSNENPFFFIQAFPTFIVFLLALQKYFKEEFNHPYYFLVSFSSNYSLQEYIRNCLYV